MAKIVSALIAGLLFGMGLAVSEMVSPARVLGFLDILGVWDPTLAFVMVGALSISTPGFWLVRKRQGPIFGTGFSLPARTDIDLRLVLGAALFGVGWGLAGFCPGPAVAALGSGIEGVFLFVAAMLAGMVLYQLTVGRQR